MHDMWWFPCAVVEPGKPAWKLIIGHFGVDVLLPDGHIDKPKLASVIFGSEEKRHLLNMCTHPYIQSAMFWQVVKCFLRGKTTQPMEHAQRTGYVVPRSL